MAPGNQSRAACVRIGPLAQRGGLLRALDHGLELDGGGDVGCGVQGGGNLPGVGRNLLQGLLAIKVLAAGDKPELKVFEVNHAANGGGDIKGRLPSKAKYHYRAGRPACPAPQFRRRDEYSFTFRRQQRTFSGTIK